MAGDWIEWSKGLASRREVVVLSRLLTRDRHEIAGRLMLLWEWADDNIPDDDIDKDTGDASLFLGDKPFEFLDALLGLPGFADALASSEVCWLTARSGGRITFPKFGRHNGTTAKTRALGRRKKQEQRAGSKGVSLNYGDICPDFQGTKSGPPHPTEQLSNTAAAEAPSFHPSSTAGGTAAAAFQKLDSTYWTSPWKLVDWFDQHWQDVGLHHDDLLNVLAMGARIPSVKNATNPVGLLVSNIQSRAWGRVSAANREKSSKYLREYRAHQEAQKHGRDSSRPADGPGGVPA